MHNICSIVYWDTDFNKHQAMSWQSLVQTNLPITTTVQKQPLEVSYVLRLSELYIKMMLSKFV